MQARWDSNKGFTIVELLIVIVVIAILATITVVSFRGIQQRSKDATIATALQNWESALKRVAVEGGALPTGETCLGKPGDFPAQGIYPENVCIVIVNNSQVPYVDSQYSGWPTSVPRQSGQLPETVFKGSGLEIRARGMWITHANPEYNAITIGFIPQIANNCGTGGAIIAADSGDGFGGGFCTKTVTY